jgi:dTDP-4-amino-4,6-dideoxygalactose transaminase
LEAFVRGRKAVALSSCTAALHLALLHLGVGPGDEVICQTFSFCASTNPVVYCGATPVFIDSDKDTWNMDSVLLEEAIQDRIAKTGKKPKAIIVVDLYGMPAQWDELERIGKQYDIPIIEDAANAMGSSYKGHICGTFGTLATLSFNGNKMITTSGGGALLCDDEETKKHTIFLSTQAREEAPYYQHETIGYNYRMSNICAGIGRGQMTVVNDHINHHKHVQKMYEELLAGVPGIHVHSQPCSLYDRHAGLDPASHEIAGQARNDGMQGEKYDSNYWLCTITIDPSVRIKGQENAYKTVVQGAVGGAAGVVHASDSAHTDCEPNANVEALRVILDQAGVEARPLWKPMHKQPVYKDAPAYVNGVSESLFKVGMCLPSGPYVTDDDVRYIVNCIKEAVLL